MNKEGYSEVTGLLRFATLEDAQAILDIYALYIENTTITYEYEIPTIDLFKERMRNIMEYFPYLVYEVQGQVVGYAYASKHRQRAAFQWGVELSIYVKQELHGKGIASILYDKVIEIVGKQGFYKVYALIDSPNIKSEQFHFKRGFKEIGCLTETAYKLGRWCTIKYYEKPLRECGGVPAKTCSVHDLNIML